MIATLNGETLEIVRHRRGVLWCPFCDHSTFDKESLCKKCGAVFAEDVPIALTSETTAVKPTASVVARKPKIRTPLKRKKRKS